MAAAVAVEDALKAEEAVAPEHKAVAAEAFECKVAAVVAPACRAGVCPAVARLVSKVAARHVSRVASPVRRGPAPAAERAFKVTALPFVLPRRTPEFARRRQVRPPARMLIEDHSVQTVEREQTAARVAGCRAKALMLG